MLVMVVMAWVILSVPCRGANDPGKFGEGEGVRWWFQDCGRGLGDAWGLDGYAML